MPKLPRNLSGRELSKVLVKYGYVIVRESGSHMRLVSKLKGDEHKITIPDHQFIKVGTLNHILADIAGYLKIPKDELIQTLFGS